MQVNLSEETTKVVYSSLKSKERELKYILETWDLNEKCRGKNNEKKREDYERALSSVKEALKTFEELLEEVEV